MTIFIQTDKPIYKQSDIGMYILNGYLTVNVLDLGDIILK